ncbi:hypothetical protein PESP_a3042 [Pseudoalteromonas espejiana DSM 9414]|nr:hypothetical protein PESP_a3042 [Pseudoalteromonas espejiana DSM 9414]
MFNISLMLGLVSLNPTYGANLPSASVGVLTRRSAFLCQGAYD